MLCCTLAAVYFIGALQTTAVHSASEVVSFGALKSIDQVFSTIGSLKQLFGTKKTKTFLPNHPYSCTDSKCAGFDYLDTRFSKSESVVRGNDLKQHLLDRSKGSMFETDFAVFLDQNRNKLGGDYGDASFVFETPAGQIGAFHAVWKYIDENTEGTRSEILKEEREELQMKKNERFYEVYVVRSDISFKLAKLRMVVHHSKKSFFSEKEYDEIVYIDPSLNQETVKSLVLDIIHPVHAHFNQIGVAPPVSIDGNKTD